MFSRKTLFRALISISLSLIVTSAMAYNIGDVVEIQPSMMNNPAMGLWYRGKVTAIKQDGRLTVVADDGTEYLMATDPKWIRAASPTAQGPTAGSVPGGSRSSAGVTTSGATIPSGISTKTYKVSDVFRHNHSFDRIKPETVTIPNCHSPVRVQPITAIEINLAWSVAYHRQHFQRPPVTTLEGGFGSIDQVWTNSSSV
jgi:hypothetical protein